MRSLKEQMVVIPSNVSVNAIYYQHWLAMALAQLSEVEKRAIVLRFFQCLSIAATADRMGKTWEQADHLIDCAVEKVRSVFRQENEKLKTQRKVHGGA
jgi:DNA-directed RNA polymerase specialized sigma24 family protein